MSRYEWPGLIEAEEHEDDARARGRYMSRRRLDFDPEGARAASRGAPPQPGVRTSRGAVARAPASSRTNLWIPLGPQTVVGGQAEGNPRITGRIDALAVHPLGERLYAASANGGVWYSGDGGANWTSLAGLASTPTAGITRPAHRNACNAITVVWGADETSDEVWVGTGEVDHDVDGEPGSSLGGIGILHAAHPAAPAEPDPWKREANNLTGTGIYKIVIEPGGTTVIAATRIGLFQRPAAGGENVDWVRVPSAPFDTQAVRCTDALWTPADATHPARLWVWVQTGAEPGLWVRDAGAVPFVFKRVLNATVAGAKPGGEPALRGVLAASTPPTQVWALYDQNRNVAPALHRVTNTLAPPQATAVTNVPQILGTQGFYDIGIDVDPADADRVALAGSFFAFTTPENISLSGEAAIVVAHVAVNAGQLTYGQPQPFAMLGVGVHADVHGVYFSNGGARLWAATDGGVFRSDRPQDGAGGAAPTPAGFYARNNGLQVVESNFIAVNPRCEGHIAAGLQDNASVMRHSGSVWVRVPRASGDGGGILPRPINPQHLLYQYVQANWSTSDGTLSDPDMLTRGAAYNRRESKASAFYSIAAGIAGKRPSAAPTHEVGQVIIGTTRVWYTEETRTITGAVVQTQLGKNWFTLPKGTDPLPADTDAKQDAFGERITVCRWQSRDVAWVLGEGRLMRYARVPGSDDGAPPGTWSRETILKKGVKNKKDGAQADGPVRDSPVWTDVAVNLDVPNAAGEAPRQHGTKGAVYLGTVGKPDSDAVDTLWWFDGTSKLFKTGLRTDASGVPAPVTAVVCDPNFPEEVYVGTTVGVWHGLRTQIGDANPAWTWSARLNGLPEAAVEDLAIFSDDGVRLLRAGIAARGVWELRLDQADVADVTYLRCHDDDLRYRLSAVQVQRDGRTARSWHGSPDVRPRVAPAAVAAPATLPWGAQTIAASGITRFQSAPLARFQSALRSSLNDPRIIPTGTWDAYFSEVLRDIGAPVVIVPASGATPQRAVPTIDATLWNNTMQPPHATREPWGAGVPTEADLIEFTPPLVEGSANITSCTLPRGPARVDIVVHHRGLLDRDGTDVRVALLRWSDPAANPNNAGTWATGDAVNNVPWTLAANEVLNSAAGTTAIAFAGGWSFVPTGQARLWRDLGAQTLDALHSGTVSFDLDFTGLANNTVVLLVAVMRAGVGASSDLALPAAATLRELAFTSPSVAVRSINVFG